MCEASSLHPHRAAKRGEITQVGTVPNTPGMKGLFETTEGRMIMPGPVIGERQPLDRALLVCAQNGAALFIERIKFALNSKMHNSEFANEENVECSFYAKGQEWAIGDGFIMRNGILLPLVDILDGTRVRFHHAFV